MVSSTCGDSRRGVLLHEGLGLVAHGLQVLGIVVIGGAQVDAVVALCRSQSLLPLAGRLVEMVQQVKALAALVQLFCIFLSEDRKRRWKDECRGVGKVPVFSVLSPLSPLHRLSGPLLSGSM